MRGCENHSMDREEVQEGKAKGTLKFQSTPQRDDTMNNVSANLLSDGLTVSSSGCWT